MVLTGYGVLRHCADVFEIQSNIWAISLEAVAFLYNLCATKGWDSFFKWFLPFTLLFSITCIFTLAAYNGILMIFVVHLPLFSFLLTGIPCGLIIFICLAAITLGTVFHTALISSLYAELNGHMSLTFLQNVAAWLRYPEARGFNVIILDAYIVAVQVIIGACCYHRFMKLGRLMGMYRNRPARHLGSFRAIRSLEEEFLPPQMENYEMFYNTIRKTSLPMHQASMQSSSAASIGDEPINDEEAISALATPRNYRTRFPLDYIEPFNFKSSAKSSGRVTVAGIDEGENSGGHIEAYAVEQYQRYNTARLEGMDSKIQQYSIGDPGNLQASDSMETRSIFGASPLESARSRGRPLRSNTARGGISSMDPRSAHSNVMNVTSGASSGLLSSRSTVLSPAQQMSPLISSRMRIEQYNPDHSSNEPTRHSTTDNRTSAMSSIKNFEVSARSSLPSQFGDLTPHSSRRMTIPNSAVMLVRDGAPSLVVKGPIDGNAGNFRLVSFEGGSFEQNTEELMIDIMQVGDGSIRLLGPSAFPTGVSTSHDSWAGSEYNANEPMTSSETLNIILRVFPRCGRRVIAKLIKRIGQIGAMRDIMRQYTWPQTVKMPATNIVGVFTHTQVESWYVDWMHEFTMNFYIYTAKETLFIFIMSMVSNAIILIRMYTTLHGENGLNMFFSGKRIAILFFRYCVYPICAVGVIGNLFCKKFRRSIFFYYRSLLALCLVNIILTFADLWTCLNIFKTGYAIQNSLYMSSLITTTSMLLFTRIPTIVFLYVICFVIYFILLWQANYTFGHIVMELLCQVVVAVGSMVFFARPVDSNRRKLFCSYTLPYLLYLEAMRS